MDYLRDNSCRHFNVGTLKRILFEEVVNLPDKFYTTCKFRYSNHKYLKESESDLKCMKYLSEAFYDGNLNRNINLKGYNKQGDLIYVYEFNIVPNDENLIVEINCKTKETFAGLIKRKM